jgi:DNA-binding XRE family transcriptional regulator
MDLKKQREMKQMTQEQVATAVGIARESYTNIENGVRRPSVDVARRIGSTLEFPWPMLFDETEEKSDHP